MFKKIFFALFILQASCLWAKEMKYPVESIPAVLKENAHSVVRLYQVDVEVKSAEKVKTHIVTATTILNKNGIKNSTVIIPYDATNNVSSIKVVIYDAKGAQVKSMKNDDIKDISNIGDTYTLYNDDRVKRIDTKYLEYPFTVEVSYDIDSYQSLYFYDWIFDDENTSFENCKYTFTTPQSFAIKYKESNFANKGTVTKNGENTVYTWTLSNLKARTDEPYTSTSSIDYPRLIISPEKFSYCGSTGSLNSWNSLGLWASDLIKQKDILPPATIAKMKEITAGCSNDFERVRKVYEFMQQKTRYVNVSMGIGGFKPIDAATVDKFSYGDCKALTNYTKALLSSIGINSHYCIVKSGRRIMKTDKSFVSNNFNHIILCVPLQKDSFWLECTSQISPCGFNGSFTDDRDVLLVDNENSRLVHTRVYPASENCINRTVNVTMSDESSGSAEVKTRYIGLEYDNMTPIIYADKADQQKQITEDIELPSFILQNYELNEHKGVTPYLDAKLKIDISNYSRKLQGKEVFLPLCFMSKFNQVPDKVRNRKNPMSIRRSSMENDTICFTLPASISIGSMPAPTEIKTRFGSYSASCSRVGNKLIYTRHFELTKGDFEAEEYNNFREFLEDVVTADETVVNLKLN